MMRSLTSSVSRLVIALRDDEQGTTIMEFGLMATVFVTLLLGLFDLGQLAYTQSVLNGAVQTAARSSSLESGNTTNADAEVTSIVSLVAPGATVATSRVSYYDFDDIERAESWNDSDGSGVCDNGESYSDENGNGQWDEDIGTDGNGGASDVVIYAVTVSYKPLFPNPFVPGGSKNRNLTASTVKKNQPFADQPGYGATAGTCD
ncbi:MAG: TadE/TadG family type IV pilus assembly protein [Marinomonas sp.]